MVNKQLKDFLQFVKDKGVIGLAVGLAIGVQVGNTVSAIVEGLINPIVAFIVGDTSGLESASWTVIDLADRQLVIGWGLIFSALITLLGVAAVVFYAVKLLKIDTKEKK
jgi:large conductance mechanosensitive channel